MNQAIILDIVRDGRLTRHISPYQETRGTSSLGKLLQVLWFWLMVSYLLSKVRGLRFDVSIAEGIPGSFALLAYKWFGGTRQVVYYAQDWFTSKPLLQVLDKVLGRLCDATWSLTEYIHISRHLGGSSVGKTKYLVVPPIYDPHIEDIPTVSSSPRRICYLGSIRRDVGIDLAIRILASLKSDGIEVVLDLVGAPMDSRILDELRKQVDESGVQQQVVVHGFLDTASMREVLTGCICGLALFPGGSSNYSNYTIPGKVREYLECGVPVLSTGSNAFAEELLSHKIGFVVDYSFEWLRRAIGLLASNHDVYLEYARNALEYAKEHSSGDGYYLAIEGLRERRP